MSNNIKLGILKSFKELDSLVQSYCDACKALRVEYVILDLFCDNWIEKIISANVDGILVRVKGNIQEHKSFFDERLSIINDDLGIPIYPSRKELFLYENKRMYEYWLTAHNFPHPPTFIYYTKKEALNHLKISKLPIVFKTNGGASSSGVRIIRNKYVAKSYIQKVFGYLDSRLSMGKVHWGKKWIFPVPKLGMAQKHYVIMQDFIPIKWEWRIIKIGNSYFGHQKLLKGEFASGSGRVGWIAPPEKLLFMIKDLCEKGSFDSMAMDVFESVDDKYYINEIQSLFGSFKPSQMKINEVSGRYQYINEKFVFEEGEFNRFGSNLLRVEDFIEKIESNYYTKLSKC